MLFLYYIIVVIVWFFAAPFIFLLSFAKVKYKNSLKARFFLYRNIKQQLAAVHFHICSLGEAKSIEKLVLCFDSRVSTITQTGFDYACMFCKKVNFLAFEPFLPFWLKPCKVLVLFEAEYWLMLVFCAKVKGAKVILVNARITEKSYKNYKRFAFFYRKVFFYIDEVFAQSEKDKERLLELGAKNVHVFCNIKASLEPKLTRKLQKLCSKLILFANTHNNEEELLLKNISLLENEKLLIAPRHPERFVEVKELLSSKGIGFSTVSDFSFDNGIEELFKNQIVLLDVLGELVNFYSISDVVVLGGSFVKGIGGHNPVEAAFFKNSIISGKYIDNQKTLFSQVENIIFCENIQEFDELVHRQNNQAIVKQKKDLQPIIQAIQKGVYAGKSL
ncbi:lipid IV(A) 3-deoxy-D-manno-octulosonic acid transferase [Campylobacter sp. MIT 21-1685]|uniref:lipid IV(A) 3-deoxy-D-manno-octulosonic acid transferase n=1 Tax=unclassified Campylobacter TaxID=2593542 RepID=UPI00224A505F|nr:MULTISPECIES: lipid IV(A) 3-deoxy-D-manno-octulosonic acid transferase [unclassified Campylobacter]MCX2682796.1 lipid IV(A) 3-deoxy-D-manno-octulosonic acid transferase [Campylobacter sp. MIT 21-1684]MCX2751058.1 lipid IV(A) 3-deoxy-D-manno-octulosonic acid transferase [Campylobacter sp. MIT 21-1682]MCX2807277.1 lipid IV(A) 3-deoxy-D-manno-octulosonic acid transferase [Campylobacter sp. MIT 21-1685]